MSPATPRPAGWKSTPETPRRRRLTVHDNGQSFQVERTLHSNAGKRLGLLGMRERVEMIGGTFGIESTPGQGTTVQVEMPFAKLRGGEAPIKSVETKN